MSARTKIARLLFFLGVVCMCAAFFSTFYVIWTTRPIRATHDDVGWRTDPRCAPGEVCMIRTPTGVCYVLGDSAIDCSREEP